MGTPYDHLPKYGSLSRWNDMQEYNGDQKVLNKSPSHRDPFIGETCPPEASSSNFGGHSSNNENRFFNQDQHRNETTSYLISSVLHNKTNPPPDSKGEYCNWNSSIDHHHIYSPYNDPYDINEYLPTNPDLHLNSSIISNEGLNSLHEDVPGIFVSQKPQRKSSSSCSLYPSSVSELSVLCTPEGKKSDTSMLQNEDINNDQNERPKRRKNNKLDGEDKICGICGDNAKSLHFGGMACDSCKAFFRRSVQTKSYHSFKCPTNGNCQINKQNRKTCQYCRFQKCLRIGMEIRWVMPESERMELWKSKLARHREVKVISQSVSVFNSTSQITSNTTPLLSAKDLETIKDLTTLQEVIFSSSAYPTICESSEDLSNVFFCICQKLQKFFFRIEEFQELNTNDQGIVMKGGIATSIYIHGAYLYDIENDTWPAADTKPYLKIPKLSTDLLRVFTVFSEIYDVLMLFYKEYGNDINDESILVLLCLIALFFKPPPEIKHIEEVIIRRNYFIKLLKNYIIDKFGRNMGENKFSHLMGCYEHTKKIVSFHNKISIEPNFKTKKVTQWNVSFEEQMNNLIEGLRQSRMSGLSEFATVFEPTKLDDKRLRKVKKNAMHAWLTSVIFGYETNSDTLLSFYPPDILIQKRPFGFVTEGKVISKLPQ